MSDTPRTDAAREPLQTWDDIPDFIMFVRDLERENNELKELHKTAITECTQYTPEEWEAACHYAEPIAVWLDGKQMTRLMKEAARLEWLLSDNMSHLKGGHRMCIVNRDDEWIWDRQEIDEAMKEAKQS